MSAQLVLQGAKITKNSHYVPGLGLAHVLLFQDERHRFCHGVRLIGKVKLLLVREVQETCADKSYKVNNE